MSTITDITVSKIYVLNVAPKTRVLDRFWYDTTNKILKKCVSSDQSKTDAECWEPVGIDPSAINVTVENGQGTSTTLTLQNYVSAVAEGLIEISGQVSSLNNTKADKTALDAKQDKLNYYNEGDNVANITSETTNTNNVVAKNITLGGYEREVEGTPFCQYGITVSEDGILTVSKQNNSYSENPTTTIDGDVITLNSEYGEENISSTCVITGEGITCTDNLSSNTAMTAAMSPVSTYVIGYGMSDDGELAMSYSGLGEGVLRALDIDNGEDLSTYSNGIRYETLESGGDELNQDSIKTMFFAGNKMVTESERSILSPVIEGELVDKELSDESLETHIPTSSAVVSYVDNQITPIKEDIVDLQHEVNLLSQQITISTHTSTFTSSSTDITNIYADDTKVALPGRIMIQPNISNVAPIYVGENITDITKAFPLYPDQITDFYFSDINNFKIACDAIGDGCNFVIEWGVTNVVADIASAFTMYDNNGNKYKIAIVDGNLTTTLI